MRHTVKEKTGVKYLNIDRRSKYGHNYVVRVSLKGKVFYVWRGNDFEIGKQIAEEVEWKLAEGEAKFLEWYDYDRESFIEGLGSNTGIGKDRWDYYIGKQYGPYVILEIVDPDNAKELMKANVKVVCSSCGLIKTMPYKTIANYNKLGIKHCLDCQTRTRTGVGWKGL